MKRPEEIKKMLKRCSNADCSICMSSFYCDIEAEALEYIQQLEHQIGELTEKVAQLEEAQPKWISVEERLPEEFEHVLTYERNNEVSWLRVSYMYDGLWWRSGLKALGKVTHWMPLPEPPRSDDHD